MIVPLDYINYARDSD